MTVTMRNEQTGATAVFPDASADLEWWAARGWARCDPGGVVEPDPTDTARVDNIPAGRKSAEPKKG